MHKNVVFFVVSIQFLSSSSSVKQLRKSLDWAGGRQKSKRIVCGHEFVRVQLVARVLHAIAKFILDFRSERKNQLNMFTVKLTRSNNRFFRQHVIYALVNLYYETN